MDMQRYILAIYVTLNQEETIRELFLTKGWQFQKTEGFLVEDIDVYDVHDSSTAKALDSQHTDSAQSDELTEAEQGSNLETESEAIAEYKNPPDFSRDSLDNDVSEAVVEHGSQLNVDTEVLGVIKGTQTTDMDVQVREENIDPNTHVDELGIHSQSENTQTSYYYRSDDYDDEDDDNDDDVAVLTDTGTNSRSNLTVKQNHRNPSHAVTKSYIKGHNHQLRNLISEGKLLSIKNGRRQKCTKERIICGDSKIDQINYTQSKVKDCGPLKNTRLKKPIFCLDCKVTFTSQKRYNSHKERNGGKCVFDCKICGKIFLYRKSRFDLHMRSAHSKERPFTCDICGKGYITSDKLKIHKRTHTGEKPCVCEECGLSFYSRGDLSNHRDYHHSINTENIACEICNMTFCNKRYLAYHKNVTHSNRRDFHCHSCAKSFKSNSSLTRHLKYIHSESKNFHCDTCDKSFKTAGSLKKHKVRHVGEKTYFCTECNKGFYEKAKLVQHHRTHSGERPYKCSFCDYRCALSGNLRKHLKTHTSEKTSLSSMSQLSTQNTFSLYSG